MKRYDFSECRFIAAASEHVSQLPNMAYPEVALVGRSNVGKSSLLNALVNSKKMARTSKKPGCTQQINVFSIDNRFLLVDLPGYGYAAVSQLTRRVWDNLVLSYLQDRSQLRRVFLLIDARHGPMKNDVELMKILDSYAIVFQMVLTKADKIKNPAQAVEQLEQIIPEHPAAFPEIIVTSSMNNAGISTLRTAIVESIQ